MLTTNPGSLTHVLNDELVLAPMFACWIVAWAVADGDTLMLPVLAITSTYVVQTFVGDAYLVLAPVLVALIGFIWAWRRGRARRPLISVGVTFAVLVVLWAPALWDELRGTRNLSGLLSFSVAGRGWSGVWNGLGAILTQPFSTGELHGPAPLSLVLAALIMISIGILLRRGLIRRSSWPVLVLPIVVILAACATSAISPPSDQASYHLLWARSTSWLLVITLTLLGTEVLHNQPGRTSSSRRRPLAWIFVATSGITMVGYALQPPLSPNRVPEARIVRSLSRQLEARARTSVAPKIVDRGGSEAGDITQGIRAELSTTGRVLDYAYEGGAPRPTLLVLPEAVGWLGRPVASTHSRRQAPTAAFPRTLAQWARKSGPLTLTASGSSNVIDRVDGSAPTICIADLRRRPSGLLDLPPESLALVAAEGELATPTMPNALNRRAVEWRRSSNFEVYAIPARQIAFNQPFISRSTC
jgi:hypothetical protein